MKKIVIIMILGVLAGCTPPSKPSNNQEVLEIAYFRVKEAALQGFNELNQTILGNKLSSLEGHIRSGTYQSMEDENLFIDLVWWRSLADAKAAEDKVSKSEIFKPYLDAIDTVIYYDHGAMLDNGKLSYRSIGSEDVLEFSRGKIKSGHLHAYNQSRKPLMDVIAKKYEEFHEEQSYQSVTNNNIVIELVYWSNPDVCPRALEEVPRDAAAEYNPFMATFDEADTDAIFSLFKRIR